MKNSTEMVQPLAILDGAWALDGGTKFLIGEDANGERFEVILPQHTIPENYMDDMIPGRLYFNGDEISVRSDQEKQIMKMLESSVIEMKAGDDPANRQNSINLLFSENFNEYMEAVAKGKPYALVFILRDIMEFVISEEYIELDKKFKSIN